MRWAQLIGPGGTYRFTTEDLEWAVKAAEHEPGDSPCRRFEQVAVLWSMANRWASGKTGYSTFGALLRGYCQPINATQIGARHAYDATPDNPGGRVDPEDRDARIRANIARPLSWYAENRPDTVALVVDWMEGRIPLPASLVGVVDFAAKFVGCGGDKIATRVPELAPCPNAEAFCKRSWSTAWGRGTVRMVSRLGSGVVGPWVALAASTVGVLGFLWWREGRPPSRRRWR
ncbi:MAG: hypothetical protein ABIG85_03335 [Chloroflexota bacterium]